MPTLKEINIIVRWNTEFKMTNVDTGHVVIGCQRCTMLPVSYCTCHDEGKGNE